MRKRSKRYTVEDFKTHFDLAFEERQEVIKKKKNDVFWQVAKNILSEKDYVKLGRSIYESNKPSTRQRQRPRTKQRRKPNRGGGETQGYIEY
jgi:hypothetical protein